MISQSFGSSESDGTDDTMNVGVDKLDGEHLFNMGRQYKMPLLRLLGRTLVDQECRYHQCTQWSRWSPCSAAPRQNKFGVKSRSRKCNHKSSKCAASLTETPEEVDYRLCEGACPTAFKVTKHGFCLKFFGNKMSNADAKASCNSSNAFLINVNTQDRDDDLTEIMKDESKDHIWVDGIRQDVNSPFEFSYEPVQLRPFNWYPGYPVKTANYDCLAESFGSEKKWKIFNHLCTVSYNYVCELVQQE